jgi:hypothetical protein
MDLEFLDVRLSCLDDAYSKFFVYMVLYILTQQERYRDLAREPARCAYGEWGFRRKIGLFRSKIRNAYRQKISANLPNKFNSDQLIRHYADLLGYLNHIYCNYSNNNLNDEATHHYLHRTEECVNYILATDYQKRLRELNEQNCEQADPSKQHSRSGSGS